MDVGTKKPIAEDMQLLQFTLGHRLFALPLDYVAKVIYYLNLQFVPGMPPHFKGLLNLYGKHVPIVDGAVLYDLHAPIECKLETPIILCENEAHTMIGIIAEETIGLTYPNSHAIQSENILKKQPSAKFAGTLNTEQGESILLNQAYLFNLSQEIHHG